MFPRPGAPLCSDPNPDIVPEISSPSSDQVEKKLHVVTLRYKRLQRTDGTLMLMGF